MFLQKFDILINKQASPITNFNDEVTKLPASDEITRIDGTCCCGVSPLVKDWTQTANVYSTFTLFINFQYDTYTYLRNYTR